MLLPESLVIALRAVLAMRMLSAQARALLAAATYAGTYLYPGNSKYVGGVLA